MDYCIIILLSAVQAITEFVPISSSGHLILLHEALAFDVVDSLTFDVMLHAATLTAVLVFFWRDLVRMARGCIRQLLYREKNSDARLAWLLVGATVPSVIVGYFFEDIIETALRSPWVVVVMLIVIGVVFLIVERMTWAATDISRLSWQQALGIGCAQALALIPGTSRSGITIIAGMAAGLKREAALRFSFLLSVPVIAGATAKQIPAVLNGGLELSGGEAAAGFIVAAGGGYIVIKYLLRFVQNHSLAVFAYYRFALALVVIGWLLGR